MLTFEPGADITIVVPFLLEGEPFIPEEDSVTYVLRDNDGSVADSGALSPGATDVQVAVTTDAADNALAVDKRFEKRTLIVKATANGLPWETRVIYRLSAWLNTTVTPSDVRGYLGAEIPELPDSAIDLWEAYMAVETAVTKTTLDAALVAGTAVERAANKAILARAVLDIIPSLAARLLQSHTDGTIKAERAKMDLKLLADKARGDLSGAIDTLTNRSVTAYPMLVFATPDVDVITGA